MMGRCSCATPSLRGVLVPVPSVESVRIGRLRRIPVGAVDEYAARLLARSQASAGQADRTVVALFASGGPAA
jgi:hypothetical protein